MPNQKVQKKSGPKRGRPPIRKNYERFNTTLPRKILNQLRRLSGKTGKGINDLLEEACIKYFKFK